MAPGRRRLTAPSSRSSLLVAGVAGAAQAAVSEPWAVGWGRSGPPASAWSSPRSSWWCSRWRSVGGSIVSVTREPPWLWVGGLFGALIVIAIAYAPPRIGTFATVALLIAGQLVAGALIDGFGWFGSPRIPVTLARALGLLLAGGAALTLKR